MKLRILISILVFINYSNAQDLDLTELKAPSSPAFTILGVQPTEISRPTTFDAFKANLFENFSDENVFSIPQNLALEFSPYWLFNHKNLTFEKLLDPKKNKVWTNIVRSSSISLATMEVENQLDSIMNTGTRLGIGYRTMIFSGSPSKKNKEKLNKALRELEETQIVNLGVFNPIQQLAYQPFTDLHTFINNISKEIDEYSKSVNLIPSIREKILKVVENEIIPALKEENLKSPIDTQAKLISFVNTSLITDNDIAISALKTKAKAVEGLIDIGSKNYKGFFLEFATALTLDFEDDTFNNSSLPKWGVWLTPSYRSANEKFEFLGVVRFIKNEVLENTNTDNFDIGAKLVFEKDKLSFSGELIQRFQDATLIDGSSNSRDDLKAVLNIEYKLTDNILITYTFGENFDVNTEINGNVISTVGLSYNIGGSAKNIKLFD